MAKRLLFVTYGGGHAHMVYPVVHALRQSAAFRSGLLDMQVLALPAAIQAFRTRGLDCLSFKDFVDPLLDAAALAWGVELAKIHHAPTTGVEYGDSVAYLGLCYQDLVERHGETGAARLIAERGRHAFFPVSVMERVFDRLQTDFVVTTNSPRSEAAAIAVANKRGMGTLAMTDLFTGLGGYLIKARNITFLNPTAQQMFLGDGLVDPSISSFYCTGNPAFDRIFERPCARNPMWMAAHFPQVGARSVVLHADMPAWWSPVLKRSYFKTDEDTLTELQACHAATLSNGAVYLVRPHPSQNRALYQSWLKGRTDAFLAADCDLHELLSHTDLLLARTTTVGLQATLMHRRVLQLEAALHPDLPLAAMGVAWGSRGMNHLPEEIGHALADEEGFTRILAQIRTQLPAASAAFKIADIILNKLCLPCEMHIGAME
ncbi:hypothetical protein D8B23_08745 [Verminephrobacter aporrectodeae subsp. tuberculatae]|uniref:Uncharacterized protein n=1 Tax=Verminephrobacter aporrectodeae subsp. tuberculatae TaxID=1110392 RepID=A0ABT3KP23_9BURK|nr:hypothetical protein [Verminephrobacter aporrectodeae]MCW5320020.1 hypothetical protein [Verminephrobacter aporrectodeae subsp. tuberculatae]MCW8198507.1 hypothetical protein [Verminephrobacter aporrectodeae subsp. tuberculatae]